jgi:hypothetical protein
MPKSNNVQGPDRRRRGSSGRNGSSPSISSLLSKILVRTLEEDFVTYNKDWLVHSGLHRLLDREGYRLRWVDRTGANENLRNGWEYVTVSHLLWWRRRIRRAKRPQSQYLMKRSKAVQM